MTDYKSMFEQAVRTLAAIDEALGIGDDGCGDLEALRHSGLGFVVVGHNAKNQGLPKAVPLD